MHWRNKRAGGRGFTLLEMLVVIVVLGLALALVVPRLAPGGPVRSLSAAATRITDALRLARSEAIAADRPVGVTFEPGLGGFRVDGARPVRLPAGALILPPPDGRTMRVAFAPDGSAVGGPIRLSVGDLSLEISVDWLTGRARASAPARQP